MTREISPTQRQKFGTEIYSSILKNKTGNIQQTFPSKSIYFNMFHSIPLCEMFFKRTSTVIT